MRILINHLTRMQAPYICVAGISAETRRHIRPVLTTQLSADLLRRSGGPFGIGCIVQLGKIAHVGRAPEVEDYRFERDKAACLHELDPARYWNVLQTISTSNLADIFGGVMQQRGRSCVVNVGEGVASLGCFKPPGPIRLYVNGYGKIRMTLSDGTFAADLSVTDIRLCETDHQTPRRELVTLIDKRINEGEDVLLSVGLTRPFCARGDTEERHWLQVNNIHLANHPVWSENTLCA